MLYPFEKLNSDSPMALLYKLEDFLQPRLPLDVKSRRKGGVWRTFQSQLLNLSGQWFPQPRRCHHKLGTCLRRTNASVRGVGGTTGTSM